jgi:hypothetical protein
MQKFKVSLVALIGVALISTGCVTAPDPAADAQADRNSCLTYGHADGSQGYVTCREQLAQTRATNRARNNAAIGQSLIVGAALVGAAAVVASQPVYYQPAYYRPYRCNYWGCW